MQFSRALKKKGRCRRKYTPGGAFISLQDQQIETVGQLYANFRIIQTLNTYQGEGLKNGQKLHENGPKC